ncbi:MAG TPA: hypothetical protein VIE17_11460 [Methylophilaceae bacterium]|jgi:hypothetical protein
MARESSNRQIHQRQVVAQQAARLMAEEGIADYAFAKRKAARQLGMEDSKCLPGNAEIESALREYQELYLADEQPEQLQQLRTEALAVMQLLQRFDPHLTGSVLDGTAGRYAQTEIHLFADSDKEVEIFLLNNKIPYRSEERYCHIGSERRKILVFVIDTENSVIRLSVFAPDGVRVKNALGAARTAAVETLINSID